MIAQLTGTIIQQSPPHLVIEVNGVGYELQAPMTTFYQLPNPDKRDDAIESSKNCFPLTSPVTLYTHLQVREDAQQLYGFYKPREKLLFRELIRVNSVGPKLALAILSGMDVDTFILAILHQDLKSLVSLPGLGKKTAERLLIDLQDRIKHLGPSDEVVEMQSTSGDEMAKTVVAMQIDISHKPILEAEEALISLGYKPQQAKTAIAKVKQPNADCQTLIKSALQALAL